jgi:small conductance mechanosensitive channel
MLRAWLRDALSLERWGAAAAKIAAIALAAFAVNIIARRAIRRAARHLEQKRPASSRQVSTASALLSSASGYAIFFIALLMILREAGVNTAALLGGAGVVGLAVGFGAQNLVRDVVTGFFIIFEGQYSVGDHVEINGVFGVVEEIGLRVTKLRTPRGDLRFFPNGAISSVNTYTEGHVPLVLHVPVPTQQGAGCALGQEARLRDKTPDIVSRTLADFDAEFAAFAAAPEPIAPVELSDGCRAFRFLLRVCPGVQELAQQKIPGVISAALARGGIAVAEGKDVSLVLQREPGEIGPLAA